MARKEKMSEERRKLIQEFIKSNDFKTAMKQPVKELDAYIELDEDNKITSADDLISFKISCL